LKVLIGLGDIGERLEQARAFLSVVVVDHSDPVATSLCPASIAVVRQSVAFSDINPPVLADFIGDMLIFSSLIAIEEEKLMEVITLACAVL
jgi:hypothetical protein